MTASHGMLLQLQNFPLLDFTVSPPDPNGCCKPLEPSPGGLNKQHRRNSKEVHLFLQSSSHAPFEFFMLLGAVAYQDLLYSGLNLASTYASSDAAALPEIPKEINTLCIFCINFTVSQRWEHQALPLTVVNTQRCNYSGPRFLIKNLCGRKETRQLTKSI